MKFRNDFVAKVRADMERWDAMHPIDYMWRQTFNIPFGSEEHLRTSFIDQLKWYEERAFVTEYLKKHKPEGVAPVKEQSRVYESKLKPLTPEEEKEADEIIATYTGPGGHEKLMAVINRGKWKGE